MHRGILVVVLILQFQIGFCQVNKIIGSYECDRGNEYIEINLDTVSFNVSYPSCVAIPLTGQEKYVVKRDKLISKTSSDSKYEPDTDIYFKIVENDTNVVLLGPYFKKNLKYRYERFKIRIRRVQIRPPWKWKRKGCPVAINAYKRI